MQDHNGCKRAYIRSSKAFYADSFPYRRPRIMVGMYHPGGGTSGEFQFEWHDQGGSALILRMGVFEDSFSALWQFRDLLEKLADADGNEIQEDEFCEIMDGLGIIDITEYEEGRPKNSLV